VEVPTCGITGIREYTENLRVLAGRAEAVDANWKRFRTECEAEEAGPSVDHDRCDRKLAQRHRAVVQFLLAPKYWFRLTL